MIVVDAGVIVTAFTVDDDRSSRARARIAEGARAPEVVGLEVLSAIRALTRTGVLEPWRAALAISHAIDLPLVLVPHRPLLARCWELRANLTPYDAAYVALAELIETPLVTTDRRLAAAPGVHCDIEVLE